MNSEWRSFLEQQGANIDDGKVRDYGAAAEELAQSLEGDTLCDLSHENLIKVAGEDSSSFLQGQLTNDIREVSDSHHQLSGYCSPKGRMLALFRLFMRDDNYYLQLPNSVVEPTLKRLRMFVLMSKVEIEDVSDHLVRYTLAGPNAESLLRDKLGQIPLDIDDSLTQDGITALRIAGIQPRFALYGESAQMQSLWQAFAEAGARPVGADAGQVQTIHAGLPSVVAETVEAFVPQMVNLQLINGVNFKKGCYTGQEVVARMQYLGKLKRRMYLTHVEATQPPLPGDAISSPESASGQGAGRIVTVAPSPQGGYDMLCVLEISSAEAGKLFLEKESEAALTLLPMPYPLELDESNAQAAE